MIRALAWRASCGVTKGPLATMRGDTSSHHTLTLENNLRSPHTFVAQLGDNTRSCNGTANSGQLPHATWSWVLDGGPVPSFKGSSGNVLWWMIPELLPPVDAAAGLLPLPAPAPAPAPADMAACVCLCRRPIPGDLHLAHGLSLSSQGMQARNQRTCSSITHAVHANVAGTSRKTAPWLLQAEFRAQHRSPARVNNRIEA